MPARELTWPPGTPCWVDAQFDDPDRAARFYAEVMGWAVGAPEENYGGYRMARIGGRPVAGIGPRFAGMADLPAAWTTYLASDDVDATVTQARSSGGAVLMPAADVGDSGRMALVSDPSGAVFGLWQAKKRIGAARYNEPGALVWNECMSRDADAARSFYAQLFSWDYDDLSSYGFGYHAAKRLDGRVIGGVGTLPADTPAEVGAHWLTYFGAANVDQTLASAAGLGAQVVSPAADTPYGRMATVRGLEGEVFAIMQVNEDGDTV
jgi:predicted enzyme related to lactoylglutathione lyase